VQTLLHYQLHHTDQSANIATLSTAPTVDLTDLNPIAWYRNGDNGAWKSPQWLIPNNENKDKVSNYSLDFDGVDDYVDTGITTTGTNDVSISCWIKTTETFAFTQSKCAFGGKDTTFGGNYTLGRLGSGFSTPNDMVVRIWNTLGTTKLNDGNWHHIAYTYDYTTKEIKAYVNGALELTVVNSLFRSKVISITDQSANIATLSTAPTVDLTDLNPIAWYRNGDNGAWKSPQWLIPNNENKDKVSNYSLDFDGVDDRVPLASSVNLGINSTISLWVNLESGFLGVLLGENSYSFNYLIYGQEGISFYIRIGGVAQNYTGMYHLPSGGIVSGVWNNIVVQRTGDSVEAFLNGVSKGTQTGFGTVTDTMFDTIGGKPSGFVIGGKIDEVSAWNNNTVNPVDIYNGGTPTTIVGASSYWKIGDNSTFLTNWTIPDEIGTSTGTSINMTIEDRVGEAPNSTNNALSINMDEVDRVEDTP